MARWARFYRFGIFMLVLGSIDRFSCMTPPLYQGSQNAAAIRAGLNPHDEVIRNWVLSPPCKSLFWGVMLRALSLYIYKLCHGYYQPVAEWGQYPS